MIIREAGDTRKAPIPSLEALQRGIYSPSAFVSVNEKLLLLVDHVDLVVVDCSDFSINLTQNLEKESLDAQNLEYICNELDSLRMSEWLPVRIVGAEYIYL